MTTTSTSPPATGDVDWDVETVGVEPERDSRRDPSSRVSQGAYIHQQTAFPKIAVLLARPFLLAICVVLGGLAGFAAWGGDKAYHATAMIEFSVAGNDAALVQLEGQTLQAKITTEPVIQRAATSIGHPAAEIAETADANWQQQSLLVAVTALAPSGEEAIARANAVAEAAVAVLNESISQHLGSALSQANSLLKNQSLGDPDAEAARRSEIGASLGQQQDALIAKSESISVSSAANEATATGVSKSMTIGVGNAVGLFAGCLISVLLGTRGLRAWSLGALRRLAPGVEVLTPAQTPELAGRMVEAGETYLAVVVTRHSHAVAEEFAANIERILFTHGKTVTIIRPPANLDEMSAAPLRADAPTKVRSLVGTDVLVVIVEPGTESAAMLEGRSGFRTVILMRQDRTPISDGLSAARSYRNAMPALMLAK
jgi:ElaB/YqjD/DUF883 family membrane-anchored ribosome-binding protein